MKIEKKYLVLEKEINYHCTRNKIESCDQRNATDELVSAEKRLTLENSCHYNFLQVLLQMLTSQTDSQAFLSDLESSPQNLKWDKLSALVKALVQSMKMALKEARDEVVVCKRVMEEQSSLLESAAQKHEELLHQEEIAEAEREKQWENRLAEIRRKYEVLLTSQDDRNTAAENEMGESRNHLEESNKHLKLQLAQLHDIHKLYKNDRACLLSCVCLLTGSIQACLHQIHQLCFQKQFLVRLSRPVIHQEETFSKAGLKYFRTIVIVVLAANRLRRYGNSSTRLWVQDYSSSSIVVPYIGLKPSRHAASSSSTLSDKDISRWLRSEQVLLNARQCFSSLQGTLDLNTLRQHRMQGTTQINPDRPESCSKDSTDLKIDVLRCHSNFINKMLAHFNS